MIHGHGRWAGSTPQVAIIGAGFAGIAAGVKLRQAGIDSFTIYEKSLDIGGTWRDNTYPGCEVDTPSSLYSFSFTVPGWSRTHARQADLRKYLEGVVDDFGLRSAHPHRRRRRSSSLGRPHPDIHAHARRRVERHVSRAHQCCRLPQCAAHAGLARARHLPRSGFSHCALGARARPDRQAGRGRRHWFERDPDRPRDSADVPARCSCSSGNQAGSCRKASATITAQEQAALRHPVELATRAPTPALARGKEPVARGQLPAGFEGPHQAGEPLPCVHR